MHKSSKSLGQLLVLGLLLWFCTSAAAVISARDIESLQHAVANAIEASSAGATFIEAQRKVVFLPTKGAETALVFAKPDVADCAATAMSRKISCRAYLMRKGATGSWGLVFTFEQKLFPLAVTLQQGAATSIWVNNSLDSADRYKKIVLNSGNAELAPGEFSLAEVSRQAHWEFDDRNSPLMTGVQRMSAAVRAPSILSPTRVLSDSINASHDILLELAERRVTPGATKDLQAQEGIALFDALLGREATLAASLARWLQADLEQLAQRVAWPQALDTRARRCTDWMVPRAFWLTESRRLAAPGFCTDVMFWGLQTAKLKNDSQALALARLYLFDDIGAAYASRVLGITLEERRAWRTAARLPQFLSLSAGLGAMLAARAGVQSMAEREASYRLDESMTVYWFQDVEEKVGYVSPTPELTRYNEYRSLRRQGLACAKSIASGQRPGCDADVSRLLVLAHKEIFK